MTKVDRIPSASAIAVLTLYTPEVAAIGDISVYNKRTYCDLHGYELIVERNSLDSTRPPNWSKLLAIKAHLHRFDWVFWTDHDSLIMSYKRSLEDLCYEQFDVMITEDSLGLNTGQMLIRNTPRAAEFFAAAYEQTQFIGNVVEEQAAVVELIRRCPDLLRIKRCPQRSFNSYPANFHRGDFLIHFAGTYNKLAGMRAFAVEADILPGPMETFASLLDRLGLTKKDCVFLESDAEMVDDQHVEDLYRKLRCGGLFAGRAHNAELPRCISRLAEQHDLTIYLRRELEPLWYCIKGYPRQRRYGPAVIARPVSPSVNVQSESSRAAALAKRGEFVEAEGIYRRILVAEPNNAEVKYRLAWLCRELGYYQEAIDLLESALSIRNDPEWHNDLGAMLFSHGFNERAEEHFRKCAQLRPDHPTALANLAVVEERQGRFDDAIESYQKAFRARPGEATQLNDLAILLTRRSRYTEAIEACRAALRLAPASAESHNNLAVALLQSGQVAEALPAFDRAVQLSGGNAQLRSNRGMALLLSGDFVAGWPEYVSRWADFKTESGLNALGKPHWRGEDLRGKTILLWENEGFGDVFQFVRYVPLVARSGAHVILKSLPRLGKVLSKVDGLSRVIGPEDETGDFDLHAPLIEMPVIFKTSLETIPRAVPYIGVEAALREQWRTRIGCDRNFKIGIAWRCDPRHTNADQRSIPLHAFEQISQIPDVKLVSLQIGGANDEIGQAGFPVIQLGSEADSTGAFVDTAAVIAGLDLVITIDTSVAHLAGALGAQVWVLLPIACEWRWLLGRNDSPWYPTMRLFRQGRWGNWEDVFERVICELRARLS